jgi:arylsulfatase A-like enzyme
MLRYAVKFALVGLTIAAGPVALAVGAERPNVLVLLSDDQRFDTIAALGNHEIHTPHLDRLVARGTAFTHAFIMGSTQPAVCVPSRAMLLSGRTLFRAPANLKGVPTWPEAFRAAGYDDYGIGKWHNTPASYARAFSNGAAIFFGGMHNHRQIPLHEYDRSGAYSKDHARIGDGFSTELFADAAVEFLKIRQSQRPFFLYVAFTSPHDPRTPPQKFRDLYDPQQLVLPKCFLPEHPFDNGELKVRDEQLAPWPRTPEIIRQHTADYYGMISHLDEQIGRVLGALEESGQAENTLVIFASDNGLAVGRHGLLGKQSLYEHSVRVPLVMAGPGIPQGKRSDALCYLFDLLPTVCELAGVAVPAGVEGQSLVPVISGQTASVREHVFGAYRDVQRMVRTQRWKLIRYPRAGQTQLFDVQNDPDEIHNLAADPQAAQPLADLTELLLKTQQQLDDPLVK